MMNEVTQLRILGDHSNNTSTVMKEGRELLLKKRPTTTFNAKDAKVMDNVKLFRKEVKGHGQCQLFKIHGTIEKVVS